MEKEKVIICGVEITREGYPKLMDWAINNPEGLIRQVESMVAAEKRIVEAKGRTTNFGPASALNILNSDLYD